MLAGFQRGERHLGMELVGRGDRHDVDFGIGHYGAPVARAAFETQLASATTRQFVARFAEMHQARPWHVRENGANGVPCHGVTFSHEARADQADANSNHCLMLSDELLVQRGRLEAGIRYTIPPSSSDRSCSSLSPAMRFCNSSMPISDLA